MRLRKFIKQSFSAIGLQGLLGDLYFYQQKAIHGKKNSRFREMHPSLPIPADRDLFETFQLNYPLYFGDGRLAANEIAGWYRSLSSNSQPHVLDWGCGVGRIVQFIPSVLKDAVCYGADVHRARINWSRKNIENVFFDVIDSGHLPYPSGFFDLVIGISVFTHINLSEQEQWMHELARITRPGAVIFISTQGEAFTHQLSEKQQAILNRSGGFTIPFPESGHRMTSTYNTENGFRRLIETHFTIGEYYNGKSHPNKMGGQDLWLIRKC